MAPASFGAFGGDLLVGNFGDGTINAYNPTNFALKGQLQDSTGKPIQNENLWEILFGSNGTGDPNTLYFSAGVNNEKGGLFGAIAVTAAPAKGDFTINAAQSTLTVTLGGSATVQVNVSPSSGFASPVTFTVSGLPTGATRIFPDLRHACGRGKCEHDPDDHSRHVHGTFAESLFHVAPPPRPHE